MKKLILLLFCLPIMAIAQQPFGYHANWYFTYWEFGAEGYKHIEHVGDTNMHGMNWLAFDVTGTFQLRTGPGPNDYIKASNVDFGSLYFATRNDSVFRLWNDTIPYLLYDFSAGIGDSWQYAPADTGWGCPDAPIATVVEIGYDTIQGQAFKYWNISLPGDTFLIQGQPQYQTSTLYALHTKIYKDFGYTWFNNLFDISPNPCNGIVFKTAQLNWYQMRCFSNDSASIQLSSQACNYWSFIGVDEYALANTKIYPNPTEKAFTIQSETPITRVEIYSLQGQKLGETTTTELIELPPASGVYLISIYFENGMVTTQKVIKR